ncbi:B/F/G family RNA polymerase sigma-70 factor [Candidatus Marinamargulisbacteria bacterium SCGC AAA071-K20]|nr:B/F/G family RNA polymerase sigma-70 factor [Candidatus Marinamargulisbacteria bacterium SCGC AAA071-K20]
MSEKIDPLVIEYCETKNPALREDIITNYKSLIHYIARKFAFNRSDTDDLIQVGTIAVLKALDRFLPDKKIDFATFATPTIIGEIKHYFRDKSRLVKVPRKLQELYSKIKTEIRLRQKDGKSPTVAELARIFETSEEKILEAMEAGQNIKILSLDAPSYTSDFLKSSKNEPSIIDSIGSETKEDFMLSKETLKQALLKLSSRERRIIYLRFYGGLSQSEIAKRMNLSQMHISRILTTAIKHLKKWLAQ